MTALAWHITSHLSSDRVIAGDLASRREAADTLLGLAGRYELLAFSMPDTHLHLLVGCDRVTAGKAANKAEGALVKRLKLSVGFDPAHFTPVDDIHHLRNALHYILGQASHHDTGGDPLRECSNLQDLLGLRVTGAASRPRVAARLPRLRGRDLVRHLPTEQLRQGRDPNLLAEAAAAALCLPDLEPGSALATLGRAACVRLAREAGLTRRGTSELLDIPRSSLSRLARCEVPLEVLEAIRLQVGLLGSTSGGRHNVDQAIAVDDGVDTRADDGAGEVDFQHDV